MSHFNIMLNSMLAYLATKQQFLADAPTIEDKVREEVHKKLNLNVGESEYQSWRNSLGNAMFHVVNSDQIPADSAIAIEYRPNGRRFRLDFVIAGKNHENRDALVIVELKQWSDVFESDLNDHVRTVLGGGIQDTTHPSYQAWSYKTHLEQFNEYCYENEVDISACAYLHNCKNDKIISSSKYENALTNAPVFLHGNATGLRDLISGKIKAGIETQFIEKIDSSIVRPSKQLADAVGSMLRGIDEFVLLDEQKTVFEKILKAGLSDEKKTIIVKGGPGTGKSVIAINALAQLTAQRKTTKYITANAAPRNVFEAKLKNLLKNDLVKHLFGGSGSYTETKSNEFDILIVDEAHRLKMKSGMFKNLGSDQTKEIIDSAKTSVFFIDESQKVTWSDVGEISRIKSQAAKLNSEVEILELVSQFRCSGSDDFIVWLDDVLQIKPNDNSYFTTKNFDFKIFESPKDLHKVITEKNQINNKSRMVAGYCWNWISKNDPSKFDINFEEFNYQAKWNLTSYGNEWIINPKSVSEIGCIHTCQGLEVDYVGVIVGNDIRIIDGKLTTNPEARAKTDKSLNGYKSERKMMQAEADKKADELIKNTYKTLMSRGMRGCYVFFQDPEVAEFFKSKLPKEMP